MSGVNITFNSKSRTIKIKDEAKTLHFFFSVFALLQLISNGAQLYEHWAEYGSWQFYVFGFLFVVFIAFAVFYFFCNTYKTEIAVQDIKYYTETPFLWSTLRYFKLKNNQLRLLYFSKTSNAPQNLLDYLEKYQIDIKR